MKVRPEIDVQREIRRRIDFLKSRLAGSGCQALVLGISGGVDSTVAGRLSRMAADELTGETGEEHRFIAMRLPYRTQADEEDARRALRFIGPSMTLTVSITEGTDSVMEEVRRALDAAGEPPMGPGEADLVRGNIKARLRMTAQYAVAGAVRGLVVGTDHGAESVTGFYTKWGDGACDLAPLFGLNKRQIRQLGRALGADPEICDKIPTADLEDLRPMLPDEDALGISYRDIDDFLEGKEVSAEAERAIVAQYLRTAHKRDPIPTP
jgi:NAD+ synthase